MRKIVGAELNKLVYAGKNESPQAAKAALVERFTEMLRERDERIAELEVEVARLRGSSGASVAKARGVELGGDYREYLERIAASDLSPARRIAALGLLTD
jgi:hypothetical protein